MDSAPLNAPARAWGVPTWVPAAGAAATAAALVWAVFTEDGRDRVMAGLIVLVGLAVVLAGVRWRQRLTADAAGVTVRDVFGSQRHPWESIQRIDTSAPRRSRGRPLLRLELADERTVVLSPYELGAPGDQVAAELRALAGR